MADANSLTPAEADDLIEAGTVGKVIHPAKGEWPLTHKIVGYTLDPEDDQRVKSLKLVTVEMTSSVVDYDPRDSSKPLAEQRVVRQVDPHPIEVTPACNPRWFAPARAIINAKTQPEAPAKPAPAPAAPVAPKAPPAPAAAK